MIDLGAAQGITDPQEILDLSKEKLRAALSLYVDEDTEPERISAYRKARRNDFYWRGIFEIAPHRVGGDIVDFTTIGTPVSSRGKRRRETPYNFNIIRGDFIKAIAVVGSKAPDVNAIADDADSEDSLEVARRAMVTGRKLRNQWKVDQIQQELMLDLSITTTTFIYTPWEVDGNKYGWTEEPEYDSSDESVGEPGYNCVGCGNDTPVDEAVSSGTCSNCGRPHTPEDYQEPKAAVPKVTGTKRYPNGGVGCYVRNIFTTSTAFFIHDLKEAEWLKDEYETTPSAVIEMFPKISKQILESAAQGNSDYGTEVRESVSSEDGIRRSRANNVKFTRYWLRPSFLNNLRDDKVGEGDDNEQSLCDLLRNRFPRGLRVTMVNGEIMDLFEESIDDCWTAVKPTVSKYMYCDPLCHDTIPIQDLTNRTGNIAVQTLLRALPLTFVDSDLIDREYWKNNEPLEAEVLPVKNQGGRPMADRMGQLPMARFSDQMAPWMASVSQMRRENNGISLELFGGGGGSQTAHEAEIKKQQALMQLRITYNNTREGHAEFTEKGVRMYARYAPGQLQGDPEEGILGPVPGKMVDIADLDDGKFHFEPDDGMPRTFEDEREDYRQMVSGPNAAPPALQHAVGLDHPVNLDKVQRFFGLPNGYYPGKDERIKLGKIVQQLLQGQPGQDGSPSVPIDSWDDHPLMAGLMSAWLNSDAGASERETNMGGFSNCVAYWTAHNTAANPQQPPQHKVNYNVSLKPDPDQTTEILKESGANVPPAAPPPPPVMNAPGRPRKTGSGIPPKVQGGVGQAVPEPANPVPTATMGLPH